MNPVAKDIKTILKTVKFAHQVEESLFMYEDHECSVKLRFLNLDLSDMRKYCSDNNIELHNPNGMVPYFWFVVNIGKVEVRMASTEMEINATFTPKYK